ncbi:MAG TPA: methyltransferase domain-containing protein [Nocardioidaceae bacterium]|nr:methyltransferase domain-containing protein [Nocardioidaceae bacterium]
MPADRPGQRPRQDITRPSAARTVVVWDALRDVLGDLPGADRTAASVVDIGGGTGGFAVRVAELGHRVTVIDPSPDALAILARRAEESGVADLVSARQGDLDSLLDLVPPGSADVLLCHGVLEIVDDPATALRTLAQALRPGGVLSLLVNQRHAAVVARAMAGHFVQARTLLDGSGDAPRRFTAEEVTALLAGAGFDTTALHGVRVFVDLVPSSLVELEPGSAGALLELEQVVATRPEYLPLATQLHALASRS